MTLVERYLKIFEENGNVCVNMKIFRQIAPLLKCKYTKRVIPKNCPSEAKCYILEKVKEGKNV